jgi:hypothetical protein
MGSLNNAITVKENDCLSVDVNSRCESNHNAFTNSLYIGYDHLSTATANLNKNSSKNNINDINNDLHNKSQLRTYNLEYLFKHFNMFLNIKRDFVY